MLHIQIYRTCDKKKQILVPRNMIPDAVFREFSAKTVRKPTGSVSGILLP